MRAVLFFLAIAAAAQNTPQNLDFETGEAGVAPLGWMLPAGASQEAYTVRLSAESPKSGKLCLELARTGSGNEQAFGNAMQLIDAAPYRGKRIRLKSSLRAENGRVQMWLRVDRSGGRMGFFDNMQSRPVATPIWNSYTIEGSVDTDAEKLAFGVMLMGGGKGWADGFSLETIGEVVSEAVEAPRPLTNQGLINLTAFARLYGYVRFFHPSPQTLGADWDTLAIQGVRAIEPAGNTEALIRRLNAWLAPIAPSVRVFPAGDPPPPDPAPTGALAVYRHSGVGLGNPGPIYSSTRIAPAQLPPPHEAELAPGLRCRVPLTVPVAEPGAVKPVYYQRTVLDRATRLAGALIAWNIFQHFYPYFDVAKTDWPAELPKALRAAAADADAESFRRTLAALVAALKDGHGGVAISLPRWMLPVTWTWAEQKLVVTAAPASGPLRSGDIVRSLNGKSAREALAEKEALISGATPQWIRWNALSQLAMFPSDSPVTLVLEPDARSVSLTPLRQQPPTEPRPVNFSEVKPGVRYVDLGRTSDAEWTANVDQLAKAKAVMFDLRGYPRLGPVFLQHLSKEPLRSAQWHIPLVYRPDRTDMTFTRGGEWNLPAKEPYLGGKRIFLTDGRAISYAESCLGIVEHYKLAEIVGGPTAGTNGNVNPIQLPGGVSIMWTGMKVLKHDGSRHHGVGIQPTVPVGRTIRGIADGRDEVLERALALVPE